MSRVVTAYAVSFNRRHNRHGHLFRNRYKSIIYKQGIDQGRRDELTGGWLFRSSGGWSEVKELRQKGQDHVKSDERILGDSEFVESVLSRANEVYERSYALKRRGYDLDRIAQRVAKSYEIDQREIFSKGKEPMLLLGSQGAGHVA
ncbi:MAG: hypothetical protein SV775_18745 [Thermodesulfobacteriota bacterium]|nr:hypothetical protein [Thermodesulfobacteriota bacterium]